MDTRGKGTAWLRNVYQYLENSYWEMDEIVQQELSKGAENLETVGANIKNFFTEPDPVREALLKTLADIKERIAPDSSLVQNTDVVPVGNDEDHDQRSLADGVHLGPVEFVKSVSSGSSSKEIDDIETKKFQLPKFEKKDSSKGLLLYRTFGASQEIKLDGGSKTLIPGSDNVAERNKSSNHVSSGSSLEEIDDIEKKKFQLPTSDKKDSSKGLLLYRTFGASQENKLDGGSKTLIPASDDIGEHNSISKHASSGSSLEEIDDIETKKFQLPTSDKKDSSKGLLLYQTFGSSQEIKLDGGSKRLLQALDDAGEHNRSSNHVATSSNISDGIQFPRSVNLVKPCKRSDVVIGPCPADSLAISNYNRTTDATVSSPDGIEVYDSFDKSKSTIRLPLCLTFDETRSTMPFPENEELDSDVTESGLQTLESSNKANLDESCIMVDGTGIQSVCHEGAKCRSYKKKFKDAVASKMRLLKNDHKQHAGSSGELDAGFYEQKRKSLTTLTLAEKSQSPDTEFSESEWEIV